MDDNAMLSNEFELPPTEQEKLLRTHNPGLALYEDTPDPPSDSPPY